jgi:DNA-binding NtrC family response regulator
MTDKQAILIVEDDDQWRGILSEPLQDAGYAVTAVAGYQASREALEARAFDLVILDLQLDEMAPTLEGERLLAHISQRYPGTPCIVVSGRGDIRVVRDAFKQFDIVDYIEKDRFDIPAFIEATQSALRASALRAIADPGALRQVLDEGFDVEEMKNLCFDLNIDFDSLRGEGKKARELVAYCRRHGRMEDLSTRIAELRPELL